MKIADFYNMDKYTPGDLLTLVDGYHPHVSEVSDCDIDYRKNKLVDVRIYHNPYIDGERCCVVGAAFFLGQPVMLFRHGGRGGHDEYDTFITNGDLYWKMVAYIKAECNVDGHVSGPNLYDANSPLQDLDCFYNCCFPDDLGVERIKTSY